MNVMLDPLVSNIPSSLKVCTSCLLRWSGTPQNQPMMTNQPITAAIFFLPFLEPAHLLLMNLERIAILHLEL